MSRPCRRKRHGLFRLYTRGRNKRYYADFSEFSEILDETRIALVPEGAGYATIDRELAKVLAPAKLEELQERRRNRHGTGQRKGAVLSAYVEHHLRHKEKAGRVGDNWIKHNRKYLHDAVAFFGADTELTRISVEHVREWMHRLGETPNGRGGTLSEGTQLHYLNGLSNLFRRAGSEGYVRPGYNPVSALMYKPRIRRVEAVWLEVHEGALLLVVARTHESPADSALIPFFYTLLATFLLTGGRKSEVLGRAVDDVSFERRTVTFRPHPWRGLKTSTSHRVVPLWPQLEEVLLAYLAGKHAPGGKLLFPSPRMPVEQPMTDLRKQLDAIATRAGWNKGEVRTKAFRHTYCATRLQTLDRGAPVSPWTVAKEMGHGGRSLVDRVYGHLGSVRHRTELVEYRVEQHRERFAERLTRLRLVA